MACRWHARLAVGGRRSGPGSDRHALHGLPRGCWPHCRTRSRPPIDRRSSRGRGGYETRKDAAAMPHIPNLMELARLPNVAVKAPLATRAGATLTPPCTPILPDLRCLRTLPHVLGDGHL